MILRKLTVMELILIGSGSLTSIMISISLWVSISHFQETLPFPGGYFIELMLGAIFCALAFWRIQEYSTWVSWIYSGLMAGFILISLFSVGIYYLPVLLIFLILSIYSDIKHNIPFVSKAICGLLAGIIQAGAMLVVLNYFIRRIQ